MLCIMAFFAHVLQIAMTQCDVGIIDIGSVDVRLMMHNIPKIIMALLAHTAINSFSLGYKARSAFLPFFRRIKTFREVLCYFLHLLSHGACCLNADACYLNAGACCRGIFSEQKRELYRQCCQCSSLFFFLISYTIPHVWYSLLFTF